MNVRRFVSINGPQSIDIQERIRAEERLKAVGATQEVAKALGLKEGYPLLSIERVSFTYGDKPMEWRLGLCLTDDHHYVSELE